MSKQDNNDMKRRAAARKIAENPCPGRSPKEYLRIRRALAAIEKRAQLHLKLNPEHLQMLPAEGVINAADDEYQFTLSEIVESGYDLADDGLMTDWQDPRVKASNSIEVITWYGNDDDDHFIIKKPVYCPLPCERWTRLPITLAQWRRIAWTMAETHIRWSWVHAVRHYTGDKTFDYEGSAGWTMRRGHKIANHREMVANGNGIIIDGRSEGEQLMEGAMWKGQIIYQDITEGFLQGGNGNSGTRCRS
jgi:hypothetical protein